MMSLARTILAVLLLSLSQVTSGGHAIAQEATCKAEQFAALIDGTGEYLRKFSVEHKPLLTQKFEQLARARNWPPQNAQEKGYQFVQDEKTAELDQRARKLLIALDKLDAIGESKPDCAQLERLGSVTLELRAVTEAKFNHMVALVDAALRQAKPAPKAKPSVAAPQPKVTTAEPAPSRNNTRTERAHAKLPPWHTRTTSTPPPPTVALRQQLPPPKPLPTSTTYTSAEIAEAGRGFFGNISASLASVIQYAFQNYGAPNGYILGTEGGAAFLAGLSFGEGHLNMKNADRLKVFWQGPSVGYDLGLQGGRVMFLVYNLKRPDQIFQRYAGIGGSAYVVGGAGLTFHKRGNVVLAPIRTGLGLRLGANIGYLKFTPRLSLNPF